jgi:hypothetical protein
VTFADPLDVLALDGLLSEEERAIRDVVRRFVDERVLPGIGGWFERGEFPREVRTGVAELGLLGMHLEGYGCLGANATSYGLACRELEAGDSGLRSFVSVQGSLSMFPIHRYGSDEQRREWLPRMAAGEVIGCFGLTEPDSGSDPARMRTAARRDGPDWILNGTKMWITNGGIAQLAVVWAKTDEGVRGFLLYFLLDSVVDDYFPVLDAVDERIETLEQSLFTGTAEEEALREIFHLKRSLLSMRRVIAPKRDLINQFLRQEQPIFAPSTFMRLVMPRTVRSEGRPFIRHSPDLWGAPAAVAIILAGSMMKNTCAKSDTVLMP